MSWIHSYFDGRNKKQPQKNSNEVFVVGYQFEYPDQLSISDEEFEINNGNVIIPDGDNAVKNVADNFEEDRM